MIQYLSNISLRIIRCSLCLTLLGCLWDNAGGAVPTEEIHFAHTDYELRVYRLTGKEPGTTMLVIGGIHNEPGGYLAADRFVNMTLRRGHMIVVPRANFYTILEDHRGIHGDMNRKFGPMLPPEDKDAESVAILKRLMAESDVILNLHDGSGYFRPEHEDDLHNPRMFGQSVIADAASFTRPDGSTIQLQDLAERAIAEVNQRISNKEFHFHFNNHRTQAPDTRFAEQRLSATYWALTRQNIPAFGIETSKHLPSLQMKVEHQILMIRAFMRQFDIIPEEPGADLNPPVLAFLSIMVNENDPVVVQDGESLYINSGDVIRITHIEANYERGLSVDIENIGSRQDIQKPYQINRDARILVRKDQFECGNVQIVVGKGPRDIKADTPAAVPPGDWLLVEIDGKRSQLPMEDEIAIARTSTLRILGISPDLERFGQCQVNFYGYAPPNRRAEDRGYTIRLDRDLLAQFAVDQPAERYRIRLQQGDTELTGTTIRLVNPGIDFVLIRRNDNEQIWRRDGESVAVNPLDRIEIIRVQTALPEGDQPDVRVLLPGKSHPVVFQQRPVVIEVPAMLSGTGKNRIPVEFLHNHNTLGTIYLNWTQVILPQDPRQIQSNSK